MVQIAVFRGAFMSNATAACVSLRYMRQFHLALPNHHALSDDLSWTHYYQPLKVEDHAAREWYATEAALAIKGAFGEFHAERAFQVASTLETMGRNSELDGVEDTLQELTTATTAVLTSLRDFANED